MVMLTKKEKGDILDGALKVFFEAMLDGYAGGNQKKSLKTVSDDGYKTISYVSGSYKVVDRYCVTSLSDFSAGTTTIFWRPDEKCPFVPVWWMSYCGMYPKEFIPFLKKCLAKAYEKGNFFGGRGYSLESEEYLRYSNDWHGSFSRNFKGEEFIYSIEDVDYRGFHRYSGQSLV